MCASCQTPCCGRASMLQMTHIRACMRTTFTGPRDTCLETSACNLPPQSAPNNLVRSRISVTHDSAFAKKKKMKNLVFPFPQDFSSHIVRFVNHDTKYNYAMFVFISKGLGSSSSQGEIGKQGLVTSCIVFKLSRPDGCSKRRKSRFSS